MKRCREATTDDPKAKHYINVLMSSVEYETFVKLMKIMRPVAEQRLFLQSMANDAKAEEKMSAGEKDAFKDMHDNQDYDIDAKSSYNKADAKEAVSENDDVKASK